MIFYITELLPEFLFLCAICATMNLVQGALGRFNPGHLATGLLAAYCFGIGVSHSNGKLLIFWGATAILASCVSALTLGLLARLAPAEIFFVGSLAWLLFVHSLATSGPRSLTGGDQGLALQLDTGISSRGIIFAGFVLLTLILIFLRHLDQSIIGVGFRAWRDNKRLFKAIGLHQNTHLTIAFLLGALLFAPLALVEAAYLQSILPEQFSLERAFLALVALACIGKDSWWAGIVGPTIFVALKALLYSFNAQDLSVPLLYLALIALLRIPIHLNFVRLAARAQS